MSVITEDKCHNAFARKERLGAGATLVITLGFVVIVTNDKLRNQKIMNENIAINIGRQFGSGGHIVGKKVAERMGFSFYDKELINIASKESGLGREFFEKADEKTSFGIFGGLLGFRSSIIVDEFMNNYLSNETLFKIQSDIIRELAAKGPSVFVGRCADYILRENKRCLNLFVSAPIDDRIERVTQRQEISRSGIVELIEKIDKKRSAYYNYYTNKTWGAAQSYHLCIDSSLLGIDNLVDLICEIVKKRFCK